MKKAPNLAENGSLQENWWNKYTYRRNPGFFDKKKLLRLLWWNEKKGKSNVIKEMSDFLNFLKIPLFTIEVNELGFKIPALKESTKIRFILGKKL